MSFWIFLEFTSSGVLTHALYLFHIQLIPALSIAVMNTFLGVSFLVLSSVNLPVTVHWSLMLMVCILGDIEKKSISKSKINYLLANVAHSYTWRISMGEICISFFGVFSRNRTLGSLV